MATNIYRTVVFSACNGQHINPTTGEFEDFCDVLKGDYTPARASRALRKIHGDESIVINNVEKTETRYSMDVETFIKYATEIKEN